MTAKKVFKKREIKKFLEVLEEFTGYHVSERALSLALEKANSETVAE